jgi:hypothetical protein
MDKFFTKTASPALAFSACDTLSVRGWILRGKEKFAPNLNRKPVILAPYGSTEEFIHFYAYLKFSSHTLFCCAIFYFCNEPGYFFLKLVLTVLHISLTTSRTYSLLLKIRKH